MIYLDNAATTRPDSRVVKEMLPYLTGRYGNPGSLYSLGREAKEAVALARSHTAELFGCDDEQVLFTSGGSEGNSLVFRGLADRLLSSGKTHILVSAVEHDSVLRVAEYLGRHGFSVEKIPASAEGIVELPVLERMIRAETGLVSVQYVNNETGAVHPVSDIGSLCAKRGILFHTDCVQAAGTEKLDVAKIGCDFATVSGHKIHAPKGVGAVFAKTKELLSPLIFGGEEQEFGFRGGTENVPGIIGFGTACRLITENRFEDVIATSTMKQIFCESLREQLAKLSVDDAALRFNGAPVVAPGKTLSVTVPGIDAQTLVLMMDTFGVCISAGSACNSHETTPSHVLTAMGIPDELARCTVRVSFSRDNKIEEAAEAGRLFANCINALRKAGEA